MFRPHAVDLRHAFPNKAVPWRQSIVLQVRSSYVVLEPRLSADYSIRNSPMPSVGSFSREHTGTTCLPSTAHNERRPSSILPETFVEVIEIY